MRQQSGLYRQPRRLVAFFAALACITSIVAFFLPIETAGKRLDQMDETAEERHGDVELTYGATEPTSKK